MEILLETIIAFCASMAFGVFCRLRMRRGKLLFAALGGALGWFVYRAFGGLFSSDIPCYFMATIAISIYSECMARYFRAPVSVYLVISLIPLVPGGGIYNTMLQCIEGSPMEALNTGLHTVGIAGALAIGIVMVSSTVRIFTHKESRNHMYQTETAQRH